MSGLRNPWRFAFDPALGEIWIGDVGQDEVEEMDRILLEPDEPPKNLGWSAYEGTEPMPGEAAARHDRRADLAGRGLRARGRRLLGHRRARLPRHRRSPELSGRYVYGDFCSATPWSLRGAPEGRPPMSAASSKGAAAHAHRDGRRRRAGPGLRRPARSTARCPPAPEPGASSTGPSIRRAHAVAGPPVICLAAETPACAGARRCRELELDEAGTRPKNERPRTTRA